MKIVNEFEEYLIAKDQYSVNTIVTYTMQVVNFLNFYRIENNKDFDVFLRRDFIAYKEYLDQKTEYAITSIKVIIHALKVFNEFLVDTEHQRLLVIYSSDIINLYNYDLNIYIPTKSEVDNLGNQLSNVNLKMYIIFMLLKFTGMTITECINLELSDYDRVESSLRIISNANMVRYVTLSSEIVRYIEIYLLERPTDTELNNILISRCNNKISRNSVNVRFNEFSDKITPHSLRHYYCIEKIKNGMTEKELQKEIGIKSKGLYKQYKLFIEAEKELEELNEIVQAEI